MDKLAELVRDSEVRGAMAAFVDLGLVKVAGQEAFDALVDAVCRRRQRLKTLRKQMISPRRLPLVSSCK